jgi:ketosteroid isomerase-like protein
MLILNMDKTLDELINTDKEFSKLSTQKGAAIAFKQYVTTDAIMLPNNQYPVIGVDNIYQSMDPNSTDQLSWIPQNGKVSTSGDMGYTWGNYQLITKNGEEYSGKYLNVWVRQSDGSWKVEVDMGNNNPKST